MPRYSCAEGDPGYQNFLFLWNNGVHPKVCVDGRIYDQWHTVDEEQGFFTYYDDAAEQGHVVTGRIVRLHYADRLN